MRILYVGWIGMLLLCFSFFSIALAGDSVKAPGVQIKANGSVVAPGVEVNSGGHSTVVKGPDGSYVIDNSSQTLDIECNGESITVNGGDNTINCHGKSSMLNVNGGGNTIHFKGTCDQLNMDGSENTAEMDRIGSITANGGGNQITWMSGTSGPKPTITSAGGDNVIKKAE